MIHPRLDPESRYGLRLTLFAAAVVLVAVPFGILLDQVVRNGPLLSVDRGLAVRFHGAVHDHPNAVRALKAVTFLGGPPFLYVVGLLAGAYVLRRGRTRLAIYLAVTGIGGGLVDTAVKVLVNRPRPEFEQPIAHALGKSFPSGHAMSSTVLYGALVLIFLPALSRRGKIVATSSAAVLVLAIAASRLALGVHFLSDVVGGIVLGLAWLLASTAAFRIWRTDRGRAPAPISEGVEPEAGSVLSHPA